MLPTAAMSCALQKKWNVFAKKQAQLIAKVKTSRKMSCNQRVGITFTDLRYTKITPNGQSRSCRLSVTN